MYSSYQQSYMYFGNIFIITMMEKEIFKICASIIPRSKRQYLFKLKLFINYKSILNNSRIIEIMKISRNRRQFQISFDTNNQVSNTMDKEEQRDIIDKFIQQCPYFQFSPIVNEEIEKFKKKVIGSANQYGTKNEKTTAIFLSLLEVTRQIATVELRKRDYMSACSYYTMCLGFIDPEDEIFLQRFIIVKIDILNKMLYCLFQMKFEKSQNRYLDAALSFVQEFLAKIKQFAFQSNLLKSDACMIQLNYFYLGRIYRKKKNHPKAIHYFLKGQQIMADKKTLQVYEKNPALGNFVRNLQIKTFYKISKCYRDDDLKFQQIYEGRALKQAQKYNPALYQYLNKKIRLYKSAKKFTQMLSKLQGKKKIQEQVLRLIQQSSQKQCSSLYDVYKDRPNNYSSQQIILKDYN